MADLKCTVCGQSIRDSEWALTVHRQVHADREAGRNAPRDLNKEQLLLDREHELAGRAAALITRENELGEKQAVFTELQDRVDRAVPEDSPAHEAHHLVYGPRQSSYGHPNQDFRATGRQWGALLENWMRSEGHDVEIPDLPPGLVALLMVSLKLSRQSQKPKRDNLVDAIGYVLCAHRIVEGDNA